MLEDLLVLAARQLPQRERRRTVFEFTACHDTHLAVIPDIPGDTAAECCSFLLSMS